MLYRTIRGLSRTISAGLAMYLICSIAPASVLSSPSDSCQSGSIKLSNGETMYFRLYVPRTLSNDKKYPLVMCLHGIGERGNDNRKQIDNENMARQWNQDSVKSKYSPFVLYPQCPANDEWTNWNSATNKGYSAPAAVGAVNVIDSLIKIYPIDTTRLYIGGLSWGGMGTEGIIVTYPNKFAAAFPCAGENRIMTPSIFAKTPFWIWHSYNDPTVDPKPDTMMVDSLITEGTPVVRMFFQCNTTNSTNGNWYSNLQWNVTQRSIPEDSIGKRVAAGAMYLFTEITQSPMPHNASWDLCFSDAVLVPWIMSKSKENGVSKFTWPPPGPMSMTNTIAERIMAPAVPSPLRVANGAIQWSGISCLPLNLTIFSAKGELVERVTIRNSTGEMSYAGLPTGTYFVTLGMPRDLKSAMKLTVSK